MTVIEEVKMPLQLSRKHFVGSLSLAFVLLLLPAQANPQFQQHEKVDVMYRSTLKPVLMTLADAMKVNLLIDSSVKDKQVEFECKSITLREAFDKFLEQEKLASLPFDRNIILVFEDTPEVVQRVQEATIWTITDLKQSAGKHEPGTNDDWLKMLKESSRKDSLRNYNLKNEPLKKAMRDLADQLDYLVMFDESVKNTKLDLMFNYIAPVKVVERVLSTQKLRARILGERTIIVFADTADKYEKLVHWTANLRVEN